MKTNTTNNEVVHLLWTGGWDSTFRLINLLLEKGKKVQPYYIIDSYRRSTGLELRTMKNIEHFLFSRHPVARSLLLTTRFKEAHEIRPDKGITDSYNRLASHFRLGSQYDWLARFAHEDEITNLELCVTGRPGPLHTVLKEYLVPKGNSEDFSLHIDKKYEGSDVYKVFKDFSFPTFKLRKEDMLMISKEQNFFEIMKLTSFCHRPRLNSNPCGTCNPCIIAMEEGFGWRLPYFSRARYYVQLLLKKGRQILQKRCPILYSLAQNVKRKTFSPL